MESMIKIIKSQPLKIWLIFLLLTLIAYYKIINNFFLADDWHWLSIAKNMDWSWNIWLTNYEGTKFGGSYSPLLVIIYKILWPIFGLKYYLWHLLTIILHASNGFLVYLLAKRIFSLVKLEHVRKWAILTGVLFLFWPIHTETIAWLAAWPHPWTLLFYLLSLIFYFNFRQTNSKVYLWLSLGFFAITLLIKEIAISLPFIILLWEIYFAKQKKQKLFTFLYYFPILILGLILRYYAIGILFGYYGQSNLQFALHKYIGNLAGFLNDLITAGYLRTVFYKVWYYYPWPLAVITILVLAVYLFILFRKKLWFQMVLFASFLLVIAPVLPLCMHRITLGGERYLYFASVFFVIWLVWLLAIVRWNYKLKLILLLGFLFFSLSVIYAKSDIYKEAGILSRQIVASYGDLGLEKDQLLISVALPDNLAGAELFRNNLQQALEFYYPDSSPQILPLPVYTQLNLANKNSRLLNWREYEPGWLAESADGSYVVTGQTSITYNNFYFELWNYNYQNYTSNIIRLIPRGDLGNFKILIFDQGILKILSAKGEVSE
ncbi:hypothetical protein K8R42_04265 [bacterium]|nr:hypothetical protein [bacterium]